MNHRRSLHLPISAALSLLAVVALLGIGAAPSHGQTVAPEAPVQPAAALSRTQILPALRKGGYIIYFRHTSTNFGENDNVKTTFEDCTKQRNLTDQGRNEARAIGAAIGTLEVPIGDVLASPYCRTVETARLMFGRASATSTVGDGPPQDDEPHYAGLRKLLSTPVVPGKNLVIVSHGNPFHALTGGPFLGEGEAALIEPLGKQGFRVVAFINKDDWTSLRAP